MFYTNYENVQMNRQYAEPDNEFSIYENSLNEQEIALVRSRVAKILAEYVKNNKKRVLALLRKHRVKTGNSDNEIVSNLVQMLFYGSKEFREDLVNELSEISLSELYNESESELKKSSSLDPITLTAIISGATALISGGLNLAGKDKDRKIQEQELKQQILSNIAQQQAIKAEQEKAKNKTILIAIVSIVLILVVGIIVYSRFKKRKA